jgi:hypothetical protein
MTKEESRNVTGGLYEVSPKNSSLVSGLQQCPFDYIYPSLFPLLFIPNNSQHVKMVLICPRIHFYEINDQAWYFTLVVTLSMSTANHRPSRFPQYLREKVQSCLTLCWTFRVPLLQKASPAQLVASTLYKTLNDHVTSYTYVDFCAGAGGPTPFIEKDLNAQLVSRMPSSPFITSANTKGLAPRSPRIAPEPAGAVKFVLTDLHPHIPDWTEASKRSENLSFVSEPVDAANAPANLNGKDGKRIFRLYNLAFHHFEDKLGMAILKNTIETADGFGYGFLSQSFFCHANCV